MKNPQLISLVFTLFILLAVSCKEKHQEITLKT
jgi:hypothetical protein